MSISPLNLTVQDKQKVSHSGDSLFKGKKVMLYFSAHWCPPCRAFTPDLRDFYTSAKAENHPIECVFVSLDRDDVSMWNYFNELHGDYYLLPYDAPETEKLAQQYEVSGIPCLVVVDENGQVIKANARNDVKKGVGCISEWK